MLVHSNARKLERKRIVQGDEYTEHSKPLEPNERNKVSDD
jgi:hypothetical protein